MYSTILSQMNNELEGRPPRSISAILNNEDSRHSMGAACQIIAVANVVTARRHAAMGRPPRVRILDELHRSIEDVDRPGHTGTLDGEKLRSCSIRMQHTRSLPGGSASNYTGWSQNRFLAFISKTKRQREKKCHGRPRRHFDFTSDEHVS